MAAPAPPKPWKAEYAKSGRSSCKTCKSPIDKDQLRLGKMVAATQFDGFMPMWNHGRCIFKKANQIKSIDDVEGIDLLRWDDQETIRKYIEGGPSKSASANTSAQNDNCAMEVSPSGRASCKMCSQKILKGTVRVSAKPKGQGIKGLMHYHISCFINMSSITNVEKIAGWDSLSDEEKESIVELVKKNASSSARDDHAPKKSGNDTKRKREGTDVGASKVQKSEGISGSETVADSCDGTATSELERKLKDQSDALWSIKDELKKHVSTSELREMLEANGQDSAGSEYDLRDRCADGMLFGPLKSCPICSGSLVYSGGQYRCHGYASAWSKCSYVTTEPVRLAEKWKIPDTDNEYLIKWFKKQKVKKPLRVLPLLSPIKSGSTSLNRQPESLKDEVLENLKFSIVGGPTEEVEDWKQKLVLAGACFHTKIKKDTGALVKCGEVNGTNAEVEKARRMKIPIVTSDFLGECVKKDKIVPFESYKVESSTEMPSKGTTTVKVKGRSAVHEASGLLDTGHILEDGKSIYNTTMNMSDLSTGVNSYYMLQIIEEDKGSDCYVFRKWGRVGNEKIGGTKLDEMEKSDAIREFKRLFLEKTGNSWEAWQQRKNFEKQPGRFFPLDIDYGVKHAPTKKEFTSSSLAPPLVELMKLLFDIETYRAAMVEFEINMLEMPLGKLSKENINKGFEALTEIQNLLNNTDGLDLAVRESLIIASSNRFFTLIPSIHPHVIRDEDDFNAKVKMLEALQDIEIASRLVGFDGGDDKSLDEKYKSLQCDIVPLPHDSEDFKLVEKYLLNTHAPTHKEWSLEVEEVFALERVGEFDKYAAYKRKLHNKMLLWHGSRLTNFVGILSQGLRIAPPQAPATGYMFGKGIYFADLVSKSAQYCYMDGKNPVGLMLLGEVALGDMHELKGAKYMDKPPKGKHSTKGLGKTVPLESEFVKWRDDVVVPCGRPVASSVKASELLYNEYIVYNTSQVKLQFLLKVRFHLRW